MYDAYQKRRSAPSYMCKYQFYKHQLRMSKLHIETVCYVLYMAEDQSVICIGGKSTTRTYLPLHMQLQ